MADTAVISGSGQNSSLETVDLLLEGDDDNCVTVESSHLNLSAEEALLASDPDVEMGKEENVEKVKDDKSTATSTSVEAQPATEIAKNLEAKEVSTALDDKKGEPETKVTALIDGAAGGAGGADDDIILLDDDDEESETGGASNSKRPRKDDDDEIMEVDETGAITKEDKESVGKIIRKMKRQDLEDLVLAKIVEGIVAHTEVGKLRSKVLELQMQKDKMASKMGIMLKQVAELASAVHNITENEARDPKNRIGKPHAIRFNRSVGLQTSIEPSVRTAPPKIIRVSEPTQNGVKQYNPTNNAGKSGTIGVSVNNGTFTIPHSQPVKRAYTGNKAGGDNRTAVTSQVVTLAPSPRKVYSSSASPLPPPPPISTRLLPIVPKTTAPPSIPQNAQPGVVDLTDDDPPTSATSTGIHLPVSSGGPATTFINGVQYQLLRSNTSPTASVQLVPAGQQKYIVASAQPRPVLLQHLSSQQQLGNSQQQIVLRGVNNNTPVTIQQRYVTPRPVTNVVGANGQMPRVAASIPVRPGAGPVLGVNSNAQRRFILPPLPATPAPKVRNDMMRSPPKPELTLNEQADGIVLSWNLPSIINMAEVTTYQIFACQEYLVNSNKPSQWKRVGDVKALPLPMACTLSQFTEENRYYFIVRGIDVYGRVGPFCDPQNILLRLRK